MLPICSWAGRYIYIYHININIYSYSIFLHSTIYMSTYIQTQLHFSCNGLWTLPDVAPFPVYSLCKVITWVYSRVFWFYVYNQNLHFPQNYVFPFSCFYLASHNNTLFDRQINEPCSKNKLTEPNLIAGLNK